MREMIIDGRDEGRRLDRYLAKALPGAGAGQVQKLIRLRCVRLNGKPAKPDARLTAGDTLFLYVDDALLQKQRRPDPFLSKFRVRLDVAYEDENLLIVDKRPGLIVHADEREKVDTLVNHARAYLYQQGRYDPDSDFPATPCNRIDRFTGGLVILAKNREALLEMDRHIRERTVDKDYLLAVHGRMRPEKGSLKGYILHEGKRVRVLDEPAPGAQLAASRYRTLYCADGLSLVACRLLTGRTHQIRAQFAGAGHPLVGDNQYGDPGEDGWHYQALYAFRLRFAFPPEGVLRGVAGKTVLSARVPFLKPLFPGYVPEDDVWV